MKRVIFGILLIAICLFSVCTSTVGAANSVKVKLNVTLDSIECIEKNHVGNEWEFACTVNKKELEEGRTVELTTTSSGKITIVAEATENDKYPDIGTKTLTIPVSKLKQNKNYTYSCKVTVTEDRGRYAGNSAIWKFTFIVKKK